MTDKLNDPATILFVMREAVLAMDLGEMIERSSRPVLGQTARTITDVQRCLSDRPPLAVFYDVGALQERGMADLMSNAAGRFPLVCVGGGRVPRGVTVPVHVTLDVPFDERSVSRLISSLF